MARVDVSKKISDTPYSSSYNSYSEPIHEKPIFHYALFVLVILSVIISVFAFINANHLKKIILTGNVIASSTATANDFLKKLTSHNEMKDYVGVAPLNIVQINNNNLANLHAQISGLDSSYIGNFIVQYTDRIVVYDYANDRLRGVVSLQQPQQGQLSNDFFTKLNKHSELQGLQNQQPIGGQLDQTTLNTLKQQFPDVYANAKVGDFLLRYQTKLVIYDYNQDNIVKVVNLNI